MKIPASLRTTIACCLASSVVCSAQVKQTMPLGSPPTVSAAVEQPPLSAQPDVSTAVTAPPGDPGRTAPPEGLTNGSPAALSEEKISPGPSGGPEASDAQRNIRFQFDGIPYMDVVERFAQMVGKPLVTDQKIEGTLTFSDPQPYTYAEAFDLINLILSMKDVMLIENDRYLRLVAFKKLPQMPLRVLRGVDQSGDVRPGEIVTVVLRMENLDPGELTSSLSNMLSSAGSIAQASRGRGLIITDRLENIKRISALLTQIDFAAPTERKLRTMTIRNASGPVLCDLITRTFGAATAPPRTSFNQERKRLETLPPSPEDYVTAVWDETSRTLVLYGPTERVAMAEDLVKRFEEKDDSRASEVKIYYPKTTTAEELARMVRQAIPGVAGPNETAQQAATKARLIIDSALNRLIVTAPMAGQLDAIEELIQKIDTPSSSATPDTPGAIPDKDELRVVRLKNGVASQLGSLVEKSFSSQRSLIRIQVDDRSNSLVITGKSKALEAVVQLITELDSQPEESYRQIRFIELQHADAASVAGMVRDLFGEFVRNRGRTSRPSQARIIPDTSANRLIICGSKEELEQIGQIVDQIDKPRSQPSGLRVFRIKAGNPQQLQQLVSNYLYNQDARRRGGGGPRPWVSVDEKNNSLIVSGTTADLQQAASLLEQVDRADQAEPRQIQVFSVKAASMYDFTRRVRELYLDQIRVLTNAGPADATFSGDEYTGRLVVSASQSQMPVIEKLLATLTQEVVGSEYEVRIFQLKTASAPQLVSLLYNALYSREQRYRGPRPWVNADPQNNSLLVAGSKADIAQAATLLEQLDSSPKGEPRQIRIFAVKSGYASEFARRVSDLYRDQLRGQTNAGPADANFMADDYGSRLIVSASQGHMAIVEKLMATLDQEVVGGEFEVRVFRLKSANASQLVNLLYNALSSRERRSRGPRPWVNADPRDNSLQVAGTKADLEQAATLIEQLDSSPTGEPRQIKVFAVKAGYPSDFARRVGDLYRDQLKGETNAGPADASFVGDDYGSRLIVSASQSHMAKVEKLLETLDQDVTLSDAELKVFKLEYSDAVEVTRIIYQMAQGMARSRAFAARAGREPFSISPDENSNSLIVFASKTTLKFVEQLVQTLDQEPRRSDREVQFYSLLKANAVDVAFKLDTLYADRTGENSVVIEPDALSNSLTVFARRKDFIEIEETIARLDESAQDTSYVVRMVPISSMPVEQMAGMLSSIYPQMSESTLKVVDQLPPRPKSAAPLDIPGQPTESPTHTPPLPPGAPETASATSTNHLAGQVLVAADKKSNALILAGSAFELDRIESIVTSLSSTFSSNETELRMFRLKEADPVMVARSLNELFRPEPNRPPQPQAGSRGQAGSGRRSRQETPAPTPQPGPPQQGQPAPQPPRIAAVPEPRTRSVIIRARPADFVILEPLIQQLDEQGVNSQLEHRLIPLEHALPSKVLPIVRQMLDQLDTVRPGEPVAVTSDSRTRSLFAVARDSILDQIEELVRELDEPSELAEIELKLFPLKNATAASLSQLLKEMLRPGSTGEFTPEARELQEQVRRLKLTDDQGKAVLLDLTQPIKLLADPAQSAGGGANRLVAASTPNNLKALAGIVELLDSVPLTEGITAQIVHLRYTDASLVMQTLNSIFQQGQQISTRPRPQGRSGRRPGAGGPAGAALTNPLHIAVDARGNTLILSGQKESLDLARQIINDLDKEMDLFVTEVRLFRLTNASPTQLTPILRSVFTEGGTGGGAGARGLSSQVSRLRTVLGAAPSKTTDTPAARAAITIQPDEVTSTLVVAARSDVMPLIEDVIRTLDIPSVTGIDSIRFFPLEHAGAANLQRMVQDLLRGASSRQMRPEDQPRITVDERTNSLIVTGNEKAFEFVAGLVKRLDRELEDPASQLTVIGLQYNDSARMAVTIRNLFAARLQTRGTRGQTVSPQDRVEVEADGLSNSLIISASKDNLEIIQDLVAKLDAEPEAAEGVIQTFTLQHAEAQRVAGMLRTLISQGVYRPGASGAGGRGGGPRASAREALAVATDGPSNTLIVSASPENLVLVKELIRQIDTPENKDFGDIQLYTLKHAKASTLATVLEQFFRAKRQTDALSGTRERSTPVTVTADDRSNTLIITAGKESLAAIERMIQQLDSQDAVAKTNFRVFPLKRTTAVKLQTTLQRLFVNRPPRVRGEPPEPISVVADSWANVLIVGASPDDLAMVESLIERLDAEQTEPGIEVQVFTLAKADARRVSQTIQSLFRGTSGGGGAFSGFGLQSGISVNVDERLNAIVVSAGETDLKRIAELVKKLDTDQVARISEIRVFPLQFARASELANILNNVLNNRPQSLTEENPNRQSLLQFITRSDEGRELIATALKEGVLISADPRTNALIVSGPLDYMELLEQIIKHLDHSAPAVARIRVFSLKNADARQMSLLLTSLFRLQAVGGAGAAQRSVQYTLIKPAKEDDSETEGDKTGSGEEGAVIGSAEQQALTVTVDLRTNSLLVGGTEHYVNLASQIIDTLDSTPAQERTNEVYRLRNSRANEVQTALRTFLTQDVQKIVTVLGPNAAGTAQSILDREVSIVAEPTSNCLLISASPRYFVEVKQLIEQLDRPQPQVLIQVLLAEVILDTTLELGVEWSYNTSYRGADMVTGTDLGVANALQTFGGYSAAVSGDRFNFLFRALENEGRLQVLSRPQILTADNQQATINVGQRVPLITDSRVTERGDTINQFTYENVGVILTVTPRISPDGFVKMDIGQTNSQISSSTVEISKGFSVPIINQRGATTTVSVQSGQSILIGGLISSTDDIRNKKVPVLGDIPGLGALFRSKRTAGDRKELLIILTPQILVSAEGTGKTNEARAFTEDQLRRSNLSKQIRKSDPLNKEMLDQIFPEEPAPESKTDKSKK